MNKSVKQKKHIIYYESGSICRFTLNFQIGNKYIMFTTYRKLILDSSYSFTKNSSQTQFASLRFQRVIVLLVPVKRMKKRKWSLQ